MPGIIRPVRLSDADAIAQIYAPYVENTVISFEYTPPGELEMGRRITEISHRYPYLVYEYNDRIIGYSYVSAYNTREAYEWTVTSSIYLMSGYHKNGIGTALYNALFELLQAQGFFNVYAVIVYPHEQSIGFHKKHGFTPTCILHRCGYKFNIWHDVMIMEKKLKDDNAPVDRIIPFSELDPKLINSITAKYESRAELNIR